MKLKHCLYATKKNTETAKTGLEPAKLAWQTNVITI